MTTHIRSYNGYFGVIILIIELDGQWQLSIMAYTNDVDIGLSSALGGPLTNTNTLHNTESFLGYVPD
ncbi:hypothetical protein NQ317_013736 [Molorchus minor]|uniref:Uncharacterized protein n=1 Tax=Molorchus minor TaxID=1323400 RepID=A0ABQ9JC92_9CUCU|nr:hypothetical protein NQ317_013736 [Molorchus minor]